MGFWSHLLNEVQAAITRFLAPPWKNCPIPWQPDSLAPVLWGFRDYLAEFGPPSAVAAVATPGSVVSTPHPCRIFYPSLDGSPQDAAILSNCGRYPVIVFAHGNCEDPSLTEPEYLAWFELPAVLARCGYVVVVPALPQIAGGTPPEEADGDLALLGQFINWVRTTWEYRETVLPPPATGIAAHSWGAGLSARLVANRRGEIAAFATLSGVDIDVPALIGSGSIPKLLMWGDLLLGPTVSSEEWNALPRPKHTAVLKGINHFDYLPAGASDCSNEYGRGPCALTPVLAQELLMMFFGRYLVPERAPNLQTRIASSLLPPKLADVQQSLSAEQQFYAGTFLSAFEGIGSSPSCQVTLTWDTSPADSGTLTTP